MFIKQISIENYKSFDARQKLDFEAGFNLIVGGNNSGKSSVLEMLDLALNDEPHRSLRTLPRFGDTPGHASSMTTIFDTSLTEMARLFAGAGMIIPIDPSPFPNGDATPHLQILIDQDTPLLIDASQANGFHSINVRSKTIVRGNFSTASQENISCFSLRPRSAGRFELTGQIRYNMSQHVLRYFDQFKRRIYRFGSDRRPGSESGMMGTSILDRLALNLPYCINHLQTSNAHGHRILCSWVNRIFPSVAWVQSTPTPGNHFSLQCLPHAPEQERHDLATPLARMGTGIGNVIAILYVVLTSRDPQVIAIDEPNAFLHPKALRELLSILESEGRQHQYLLTAHSADVLTAVNAKTISFLELEDSSTVCKQTSQAMLHTLQGKLADLGIRVTDLHGKDKVLWVEGQSEELAMPGLLRFACPEIAAGTAVLRVERTGTYSKKGVEPDEVAALYQRLSTSSGLVPPMICIVLDAETRTEAERRKIEDKAKGAIRFLDRRMLENYLLSPSAVYAALTELGCSVAINDVEAALAEHLKTQDQNVLRDIDGAAVLTAIFSSLSDAKQEFRKTRDVPTLVTWLIENEPMHLAPLKFFCAKSPPSLSQCDASYAGIRVRLLARLRAIKDAPGCVAHQALAAMPGIGMKPSRPFMRSIHASTFGYGARSMPPSPASAV